MPVKVFKKGKKYCVYEAASGKSNGRKGRCHASRNMAVRQSRAINMNLRKAGKI